MFSYSGYLDTVQTVLVLIQWLPRYSANSSIIHILVLIQWLPRYSANSSIIHILVLIQWLRRYSANSSTIICIALSQYLQRGTFEYYGVWTFSVFLLVERKISWLLIGCSFPALYGIWMNIEIFCRLSKDQEENIKLDIPRYKRSHLWFSFCTPAVARNQ